MEQNQSDIQFVTQTLYAELMNICRINTKTETVRFIKSSLPCFKTNEVVSYAKFVEEFSKSTTLYSEDKDHAIHQMEISELRRHCLQNETGEYLKYRYFEDGKITWISVLVFRAQDYSDNHPEILLFDRRMNQNESQKQEARAIVNNQFHKIFIQNISTNETSILKQYRSEQYISERIKHHNDEHHKLVIQTGMIHPDDLEIVKPYTDTNFLNNYFTNKHQHVGFYYRRKIGSIFQWVNQTITPTANFSETNKEFISFITDANEVILKYFDSQNYTKYEKLIHQIPKKVFESYYEYFFSALNYLTTRFTYFYMIDLEKDIYINYKIDKIIHEEGTIGRYSELGERYNNRYEQLVEGVTLPIPTIKQIETFLSDRSTITYKFKSLSGQMLSITFTKFEDKNGKPVRVFCFILPAKDEELLKIKTFGNFEIFGKDGNPLIFSKKLSKEIMAYLVDKRGYSVTTKDLILDILEDDTKNLNAAKYISKLICSAIKDLEAAGYDNIIVREKNSLHLNESKIDCDFYNLLDGDISYWQFYHNEYMKDYSWAEESNAMLMHLYDK